MMVSQKGLVLREVKVGDYDKIITILTPEFGKISASVKGVKSITSRRLGGSNPFCYCDFTLNERNAKYYVDDAKVIENFFSLNKSIERLSLASYFLELVSFVSSEMVGAKRVLPLTLNALYMLAKGEKEEGIVKAAYELRLLCEIGHMPDLLCCVSCGEFSKDMLFDVREGVLVCRKCLERETGGLRLPLKPSVLKAMRFIVYGDENKIFSFDLKKEGLSALTSTVESYLLTQLDSGFSTLNFYKSLKRDGDT